MARSGPEILVDTLLKASGIDPEAFKRDVYGTINAVKSIEAALKSIDYRLERLENALHVVNNSSESEPKQITNGAANG